MGRIVKECPQWMLSLALAQMANSEKCYEVRILSAGSLEKVCAFKEEKGCGNEEKATSNSGSSKDIVKPQETS